MVKPILEEDRGQIREESHCTLSKLFCIMLTIIQAISYKLIGTQRFRGMVIKKLFLVLHFWIIGIWAEFGSFLCSTEMWPVHMIINICFVHPKFRFWFLVIFGNEVTKIRKYFVVLSLFTFLQDGQEGKKQKEDH